MWNFGVLLVGISVVVVSAGMDILPSSSIVTSSPNIRPSNETATPVSKDVNERQIEDTSATDFVDEMLNLFVQFVSNDKDASSSGQEESKLVNNASEGRGVGRLKKFLLPFLLGVSMKTKAVIIAAIGFLMVLTKITFIKSKIALVIGVGLLLYHLYVKKHAIHHIKHALHHPVPYDVSPAWSAPLAAWAIPDWGAAAALPAAGHLAAAPYVPHILRKTSHEQPTRFRR
ncbi:unnamed protein product [Bemisia tabaci]|uniref:Uncharacterized protein n=1 Tax=Bemisia tabaci TaxID=7038 RepID=A0A9P0F3N6_BEMTA|nr:unnamed protein product [Bemisia tabaci]